MLSDMTGTPVDPGHVIAMAQDASYDYIDTAGAWLKAGRYYGIDSAGIVTDTSAPGALLIAPFTAERLARSTSHTTTTFASMGATWSLYEEGTQAVAQEV